MGIQVSGLLANSAFDWKSVVDQLIAAESIPMTNLKDEQTTNTEKITALANLQTAMQDLQDTLQTIRSSNIFTARTVSTDTTTTWKSTSSNGAPLGSYKISVTQLATKAQLTGASDVGSALNSSSDVSGLTLANLRTATAVTAGQFTVNGKTVTVATTDSLKTVFDAIKTATGDDVTASYDPTTDTVKLTSASSTPIVLGAANDTSNFLSVFKLANNSTGTITSSAKLGTLKTTATLGSMGLKTALSGQDSSGNGSFTVNGVSIDYNVNTDTLASIVSKINKSTAGVTASYDSATDRVVLMNNTTGDMGLGISDVTGNLAAALGLGSGSATLTAGKNAIFTVNDGTTLVSASNTLTDSIHGITGLSVTVNTLGTQTLQVESDATTMQSSIQSFIDKFNAVQDLVSTSTKVTITGTNVSNSVLSGNREVESWAQQLQKLAFAQISGASATVDQLDDLGIDFDGITGKLTIKDSGKLVTALSDNPADVNDFFLSGSNAFVTKMYGYLTTVKSANSSQQSNLTKANTDLQTQIDTMQTRLDNERTRLTEAFTKMLDAQSAAQSATTTLTNAFLKSSSSS